MGAVKHYLNDLICACSDEQFGQDAIEHAITAGRVHLVCNLETDSRTIMGQYSNIIAAYRRDKKKNALPHFEPMREAL